MEQAKLHLSAFLWVAGLISGISTVAGLFKGNAVYILTAAGYMGMVALLPLGIFSGMGWLTDLKRIPIVGLVSAGLGLVCLWLFPLRDFEVESFNTLSAIGILVIIGSFIWGVRVYREYEKAQKPAEKVCPDCARTVLMTARVCEHCGYRFQPSPKNPDDRNREYRPATSKNVLDDRYKESVHPQTPVSSQENEERKIIIRCENCKQKLSIPLRRKSIHVTCPKCRYEFNHEYVGGDPVDD